MRGDPAEAVEWPRRELPRVRGLKADLAIVDMQGVNVELAPSACSSTNAVSNQTPH